MGSRRTSKSTCCSSPPSILIDTSSEHHGPRICSEIMHINMLCFFKYFSTNTGRAHAHVHAHHMHLPFKFKCCSRIQLFKICSRPHRILHSNTMLTLFKFVVTHNIHHSLHAKTQCTRACYMNLFFHICLLHMLGIGRTVGR